MSESMVARVARAIALASLDDDTRAIVAPETWPVAESYYDSARAAIEAMREPNVDMMDSACAAWVKLYPAFEGEKPQPKAGEVATTIFNAMIDAALTPAKVDEAG